MLTDDLKEQTKVNHQLLEKKLVTTMRAMRNRADYAKLLTIFYSYFGGLEQQINTCLTAASLPDYGRRRKATALSADIRLLGVTLPDLASADSLPHINTHLQALGALYLVEGSTLGGKIISQMISKQLAINEGISFFNGYGDDTMAMWQQFKLVVDRPENLPGATVIDTANETFLKFGEWFDLNS